MEIFVAGVNHIRKIKGLTQEDLADLIPGGKRGTVSSWLRGRTKFPKERVGEFSDALCVSVEDIMQAGRENKHTGKGSIEKLGCGDENNIDPITKEHQELVKEFNSKQLALDINKLLLKIEQEGSSIKLGIFS